MASRRAAASSLSVKSPSELRLEQFQCWSNRRFWAASHLGASANQDDMINVPRRKPDDWPRPVPHKLKLSERQRCILNKARIRDGALWLSVRDISCQQTRQVTYITVLNDSSRRALHRSQHGTVP